ncbi:tubulin polyglutamylase complex subunit 1-like [Gigantopelta aegis]|uniref:tubulin polyglutamylase complex subunit 1-like n=1 Tax=Gigantopelta aegis TaxID=1735272 RepID=UPI001B88B644|nr:tubulin polyglutamylase complex subunit 1-like [Gigantopelta aegis]
MADRRKPVPSEERIQETDRQFLERTGVGNIVRDVLAKIVANRPADPIDFLATYFVSQEEQSTNVQRACQVIQMTHHSRPVFESNVRVAYDILSKPKTTGPASKVQKKSGLSGAMYTDVLYMLCSDIPTAITSKLMKKIQCFDFEAVPYDVFRSAVFTCCVLQDYVALSAHLFDSLDSQKSGKANKVLCDAVLDQLRTALGSSRNDVKRIMESGYNLGPDGLHLALDRALTRERSNSLQTLDNFVMEACDAFLTKVKKNS